MPVEMFLVGKDAYQLRYCNRRMSVVQLDRHLRKHIRSTVHSLTHQFIKTLYVQHTFHHGLQFITSVSTRYPTARPDKRVRSTILYHSRQCGIVLKLRSNRTHDTVVCFMTHAHVCSRKLRKQQYLAAECSLTRHNELETVMKFAYFLTVSNGVFCEKRACEKQTR